LAIINVLLEAPIMPSMSTLPKFDALMIPTLRALKTLGGSASNDELFDRIVIDLSVPDELRDLTHEKSGQNILANNLAWARVFLHAYGAITRSERGVWALTDQGEKLTDTDAPAIKRTVRDHFSEKRKAKVALEKAEVTLAAPSDNGDEESDSWTEKLLAALKIMDASAFERLCQRILRESGFTKVEVTGRSGDGGIDGVGILRVKLVSFQVLFQSKRWKDTVGPSVVRDFRGAMVGRADKGLIITTATFTSEARREATRDGAPAIDLIDGAALCELLKELRLGVRGRQVEEVEIEKSFFNTI
jgi:restriction system protein